MKANTKSIGLMTLIAMIGGVLAIVGFFLTVTTVNIDVLLGDIVQNYTGTSIMDINIDGHKAELSAVVYMPLLALIFGILTVLVSILPLFTNKLNMKTISMLQLLFGLLTAVFGIVYMVSGNGPGIFAGDWNTAIQTAVDSGIVTFSTGPGAYLPIAGGVIALLGGLLNFKESR